MYVCVCVCVCVCVWLNWTDTSRLPFLSLIHLDNRILTFRWMEFEKAPYISQVLTASTGVIFGGVKNQMTFTMTSYIY